MLVAIELEPAICECLLEICESAILGAGLAACQELPSSIPALKELDRDLVALGTQ
jgi:hypothetical protein